MSKRLLWADCLKGFLMILVIIGHVIWYVYSDGHDSNHFYNLIYSFHMPCFMAISGWLCYRPDSDNPTKDGVSLCRDIPAYTRRFKQLLIPYLIWSLVQAELQRNSLTDIILTPNGYFWFLWALFWIYVLFKITGTVALKLKITEDILRLFVCAALVLIMQVFNFRLFSFQLIAYYFLYYFFGYIFHKYEIHKRISLPVLIILSIVWLFLGWGWSMHSLPQWMPKIPIVPDVMAQQLYRVITAFMAITVLLTVSPKLWTAQMKANTFMCYIGNISLGLYIVHVLILKLMVTFLPPPDAIRGDLLLETLFTIALTSVSIVIVQLILKSKHLAFTLGKV